MSRVSLSSAAPAGVFESCCIPEPESCGPMAEGDVWEAPSADASPGLFLADLDPLAPPEAGEQALMRELLFLGSDSHTEAEADVARRAILDFWATPTVTALDGTVGWGPAQFDAMTQKLERLHILLHALPPGEAYGFIAKVRAGVEETLATERSPRVKEALTHLAHEAKVIDETMSLHAQYEAAQPRAEALSRVLTVAEGALELHTLAQLASSLQTKPMREALQALPPEVQPLLARLNRLVDHAAEAGLPQSQVDRLRRPVGDLAHQHSRMALLELEALSANDVVVATTR